jgi:hypothetical protein
MIKFFRHIRKTLLIENSPTAQKGTTRKYFKYAIGEIVLVVIGILIALQINNWNELQKNKKQELVILTNILQDLKLDEIGLKDIIEKRTKKIASADIMVRYYHGIQIKNLNDYYYHWTNVLYWVEHNPRNIAFKELVNAGNVSVIKNTEIRNSLLEINASYEELFAVRKHLYDDYTIYLYTPFSTIFDYENGIKVWTNPNIKIDLSLKDVNVALQSKAIKNGFTLASFNNTDLRVKTVLILKTVKKVISLIEKETQE